MVEQNDDNMDLNAQNPNDRYLQEPYYIKKLK